jgi:hypothetical protein
MKKSLTSERVKLAKLEPAALFIAHLEDHTVIALCAAQYSSSNRQRVYPASIARERRKQKEVVLPLA